MSFALLFVGCFVLGSLYGRSTPHPALMFAAAMTLFAGAAALYIWEHVHKHGPGHPDYVPPKQEEKVP